jgi:adenine phosphoribosyltransferase
MKASYYSSFLIEENETRCDMTPIFEDAKAFSNLVNDLIKPFKNEQIDKIIALDALGFVLGGAIASKLGVGLIVARKGGKLPRKKSNLLQKSFVDYTKTKKSFEINKSAIKNGEKLLLVDEWIETGSQVKAAISLVEKANGKIIGISTLGVEKNNKTKILFEKYNLKSILIFKH